MFTFRRTLNSIGGTHFTSGTMNQVYTNKKSFFFLDLLCSDKAPCLPIADLNPLHLWPTTNASPWSRGPSHLPHRISWRMHLSRNWFRLRERCAGSLLGRTDLGSASARQQPRTCGGGAQGTALQRAGTHQQLVCLCEAQPKFAKSANPPDTELQKPAHVALLPPAITTKKKQKSKMLLPDDGRVSLADGDVVGGPLHVHAPDGESCGQKTEQSKKRSLQLPPARSASEQHL